MKYWDSYEYPEGDPKVRVVFGPQSKGAPVIAWIGRYGATFVPPDAGVEAEFSLDCDNEDEARKVMNAHADKFIRDHDLKSVPFKP